LFSPGSGIDISGIMVSVVGRSIFRTYRYQDNSLKPMPTSLHKRDPQNYTAHAWLIEGAPGHPWESLPIIFSPLL
jgi:hypothetical protein